jgi:hypothetical protein
MKTDRSAEFIRNMTAGETAEQPAPAVTARPNSRARGKGQQQASRAGLKHFGGYLDDSTLEKIALLRVRLKKDNSELIKQAIDELYAKNHAKRVFGDA